MNALHEVRSQSASKKNLTIKQVKNMLKRNQSLVHRLQKKLKSMQTKKQNKHENMNVLGLLNGLEELGFLAGGRQTRRRRATRGRPLKRA